GARGAVEVGRRFCGADEDGGANNRADAQADQLDWPQGTAQLMLFGNGIFGSRHHVGPLRMAGQPAVAGRTLAEGTGSGKTGDLAEAPAAPPVWCQPTLGHFTNIGRTRTQQATATLLLTCVRRPAGSPCHREDGRECLARYLQRVEQDGSEELDIR